MRTGKLLLAAAGLLLLSGCEPAVDGHPAGTQPPAAEAEDGTRLATCRDARCEVEVRDGDQLRLGKAFGIDVMTVHAIAADRIDLRLLGSAGGFEVSGAKFSISTKCVGDSCRDTGSLSVRTSIPGQVNQVEVRLVRVDGGRAVLALKPLRSPARRC